MEKRKAVDLSDRGEFGNSCVCVWKGAAQASAICEHLTFRSPPLMYSRHRKWEPLERWHATIYFSFFRWTYLMQLRDTRKRAATLSSWQEKIMGLVHLGTGLQRDPGCRYVLPWGFLSYHELCHNRHVSFEYVPLATKPIVIINIS